MASYEQKDFGTPDEVRQFPMGRLELVNRAKLWRTLTGDQLFDIDYYLTREQLRPQFVAPGATDVRLGSSAESRGWGH